MSQKFLIVINEYAQNITEALNKIFSILWANGLIDSHILTVDEMNANSWTLYTFLAYQSDCFSLTQIKIATFTQLNKTVNMTLSMNELYPLKLKDFFNCPLYYGPSLLSPFVIFRNVSDLIEGIDVSIVSEIARLLKLNTVYRHSHCGTGHGTVFENGTISGNLGLVWRIFTHK